MKYSYLISALLLAFSLVSCTNKVYMIEERASKQVPVSLSDELTQFKPGVTDIAVEQLSTVYANDTICLLQLKAVYKTPDGKPAIDELQYVYFIDMMQSRFFMKPIYVEEFRTVPLLTEKEIRECRRHVRKTGESVYNSFIGHGGIVKHNYDE